LRKPLRTAWTPVVLAVGTRKIDSMPVSPQGSIIAAVCLAAVFLTAACSTSASPDATTGAELYRACVSCHGPDGGGDITQGAPAIAGLPAWYVALQLERFQTGLRGKHPDDVEGLRMRPMSLQMKTETQTQAVAAYVAGLAPVRNPAQLAGADAAAGAQTYVMCIACHGAEGEGNQAVNAPPLAGLDDWYVARQLRKFRAGVRGSSPEDTIGPAMAAHVHAMGR
jgi:cytochrome c oxidase subunit 2